MEKNNFDVLIVGRYFSDLIFTGLPELPRLGHEVYSRDFKMIPGGVYNAAIALYRLGVKIVWPCKFGNDPFSQFVKKEALKEGVPGAFFSDLDHPSLHLTAAFSYEQERAFLSYSDPIPDYEYHDLILKTRPQWVYITHLLIGEELDQLVEAGRTVKAKIFMDCQAHHYRLPEPEIQKALRAVDIFSPNRAEAEQLIGVKDMGKMLDELSKFAGTVVIKDGSNGSYLKCGDKILYQPSIAIDVMDTTGAGDNFDSGFLYGQIRGLSLQKSLAAGNICGALSAQGIGGSSTAATEKELLHFLEKE